MICLIYKIEKGENKMSNVLYPNKQEFDELIKNEKY